MSESTFKEVDGVTGRVCTVCDHWKCLSDFNKSSQGYGGINSRCRECQKQESKRYREENKEKTRAYKQKYYWDNRESELKRRMEHYELNREKEISRMRGWKETNKQKVKRYYYINRDRYSIHAANRRAKKANLPNDLTATDYESLLIKFGGCALTGDKENIQMDHVIPISTGFGGTTLSNVIPLRADLNQSKNGRNIFTWFETHKDRYRLSESRFLDLIKHLSQVNGMDEEEYQKFVSECHNEKSCGR